MPSRNYLELEFSNLYKLEKGFEILYELQLKKFNKNRSLIVPEVSNSQNNKRIRYRNIC